MQIYSSIRMLGFLIHMFLLSAVVTSCPVEHNPLTLDPPEVIIKFGNELLVNCTSKVDDFEEMYWSNEISLTEEDNPFISWSWSVSDWDVNSSCKIKLNDSLECSKDLKITVYKSPDRVDLHPSNTMVEGTQHELHCDIVNVAPVQNLTVRWYRNNAIIMTESFNKTTKTPANESSTLLVNMSRGDSGVVFKCEAQLDFDSDTLVTSDMLNVSVHYAPEIKNHIDGAVYVEEGTNVTLKCEPDGNPLPQVHWTRDRVDMLESTNNLSLTITKVNANATYSCTATNYLGSKTKQVHVYVINIATTIAMTTPAASAPEDVTVNCLTLTPSELVVRFGDPASINCSSSVPGILQIGWDIPLGLVVYGNVLFVPWIVDKLDIWNPQPLCYVTLLNGHQCNSTPSITVYKTPDLVSVSSVSHKPMVEGTEHLLRCDIINVAPVRNLTVKFYRGTENVHTEMFNDNMENTTEIPQNLSFVLRVTPDRRYDGTPYTCTTELHLGSTIPEPVSTSSEPYIPVVLYAPRMTQGNHSKEISLGDNVTFGCLSDGNPAPEIHWEYVSAKNVMETTWGRQKNITIREATSTNAGNYICVATNEFGRVTRFVTLMIKEETEKVVLDFPWWYILLIVVVIAIVCLMLTLIKCKKHGQYTFVKTNEEIPLDNK